MKNPISASRKERDLKYEELGLWKPLTIGDHLKEWSEKYNDKTAVVDKETRLSYKEMDLKADELASGLLELGIKKGDKVVVQLPNSISFIITCFALLRLGAVPILSMPAHREAELEGIFELAEPTAYFITDKFLGFDYREMAEGLLKRHSSVKLLITDGENSQGEILSEIKGKPQKIEGPEYKDTAFLLLSGGTTGTPKLIPRSHTDYSFNFHESAKKCGLTQESTYLAVLPIAHNFPLACPGILGTFSAGGKVVLSRTTSYDETFPLIEKEKVNITALVPAIVNIWLQALEWDDTDISSLKMLQVGGSPLDENLALRIAPEMNCKLQQVFGMAEGLLCYTSLDDKEEIIKNCQGKPLSEYDEIRVVDEDGNDAEPGEFGELLVRGPYTIAGYYLAEEQNKRDFTEDGFYKSGDKVRFTKEGNIQVRGRIKEQINRAGEKIMASEIESYLNTHPEIEDSAVVSVKDEELGERSCAFIISENKDLALKNIHDYLKNIGVARYKMPDQLEHIDFWPLTSVGKVDKKKLTRTVVENEENKSDKKYLEKSLKPLKDPMYGACRVIESGMYKDYVLYENKGEWSLGLGKNAELLVNPHETRLKVGNKTHVFQTEDISLSINEALNFVPYENWRAYGISEFELSRYTYGLEKQGKERDLLKLFIPESEVRFTDDETLIRALNPEDVEKLEALIDSVENTNQEESIKTDLSQRVEVQKYDIPEINTHNSENYKKIVKSAVEEIQEPQYQKVILSRKVPLSRELDMVASYIAGRRANTPARSFLLSMDELKAGGFSPETVVEVDEERIVSTQPLAGTRSTGVDYEEEIKLREELLNNTKEIAEHAISIKLAFEELLEICDSETITLSDFMTIARRGTVQHLASRLKGRLKKEYNPWHAFKALFPAVTATGIPKKESIDAIKRFEPETRHLYSGCVMTYDSNGKMDAALVLRSFFQEGSQSWLHAGAGIVDMSTPERELEETCEKLRSVSNQIIYS